MNELAKRARLALSLMDLTRLEDNDTPQAIDQFCRSARTAHGHPAAICVYPQHIDTAKKTLAEVGLSDQVRIATVANFPGGDSDIDTAAGQTGDAIAAGADEVDVVFPFLALLSGNEATGQALVAACREAAAGHCLKVILETGELADPALIRRAAKLAIAGGADFLKTSTGKVAVNATPEAARILVTTIRDSGQPVGCKVSGGIRTFHDASVYLDLAADIMGDDWLDPDTFRFGASGLLDDLLATLGDACEGDT